jgi:hypothetical protein
VSTQDGGATLPPRDAHSLVVHTVVDVAVAFLACVVVLLILGASIWVVLVLAVVLGVSAAPFTRRAEVRALAKRGEGRTV